MHSLRSYGEGESAYDNNAYTVTSIYHGGQLKMYTSHPVEGTGPHAGKSEYYMHQINTYGMTGNPETFRQGATAFRNLRDWTEEQRNAAIARANEKANDAGRKQSTIPAITSSFTTEVSSLVAATSLGVDSESQSQESFTTQNRVSYVGETTRQESETSADEPALDAKPPAKRLLGNQHSGRRKRNAGESSGRGGSATVPPQREQWSWASGAYCCFRGPSQVSSQENCPADVWVYFKDGWPGEGGKPWRRWQSSTNQVEYL